MSSLPDSAASRASLAGDAVLDRADIRRGADQQLAELAAVLADRVELGLEPGGDVRGLFLLGLDLLQLFLPRALGGFGRDRDPLRQRRQAGGEQDTRANAAAISRRDASRRQDRVITPIGARSSLRNH